MPANRLVKTIKKDDTVKVIAGKFKGKTGKVLRVSHKEAKVFVEGLGVVTRHIRPNQFNPRGGSKEVHVGLDVSKVVKSEDKKTSSPKKGEKK